VPKILVVEDDPASLEFLRKYLQFEQYEVLEATDGGAALELAAQADLVLLDVMLPVLDGMEVAETLRQDHPDLPILMLTALATTDDQVRGLETGADDYVTKPYNLRELGARIKALLRRTGIPEELVFDHLRIAPHTRQVYLHNKPLALSKVEFDILLTLARNPGRIFSRQMLLERIWGGDYFGMERVVDVRVVSLRKKLAEDSRDPRFIETVRGVGYRFKASHS
jgi:two-component system alkaline phosphatase synthesis response regulator PhoP